MLLLNKITKKNNSIWLLFTVFFCIEFLLFRYTILKEISPYYPSGFDQSIFLLITYTIYENIKHHGFFSSLHSSPFLTTGALFPYQAVLFFFIFGISRFSALVPNITYFIVLQVITLMTLRDLTQKNYLSILMLGFILTIQSPMQFIGGVFDFRMDFIAFCLYGIFTAAVIKSQLFFIKKWSFIAGLCAILIILMRTITLTYMIGVIGIMTIYFLYQSKKMLIPTVKNNYKTRLYHSSIIFLSIICTSIIYIYLNKNFLYQYYVIHHVINNEKYIRVIEAGIKNSYLLWGYYPYTLFSKQMGTSTWMIMLTVFSLYLFSNIFTPKNPITSKPPNLMIPNKQDWYDSFLFLTVSFLIPMIILTFDTSKSSIVGSIAVIPFLWLFMWIILFFDNRRIISKKLSILLSTIAAITLFIGLNNQIHNHLSKKPFDNIDRATITQMYLDIGDYAVKHNWSTIYLSTDRIADYLIPTDLQTIYYENHRKLLTVHSTILGGNMFQASDTTMLNALKKSHIVIFNISNNYPNKSPYPADLRVAAFSPILIQQAEQLFDPLGDYKIKESTYRVYVKKTKK
jgi:hypothetical protein